MTDDSEDGVWVFRLRPGMTCVFFGGDSDLPSFGRRPRDDHEYRIIEDPDVAEQLKAKEQTGRPMFRWMDPEDVDAALGSADEAIEQIEAGEWDSQLDFLLIAERRAYGRRVTVIDAIAERNGVLREQLSESGSPDDDVIAPHDIVTAQ